MSKHLRTTRIIFALVCAMCIAASTRVMACGDDCLHQEELRRQKVEAQLASQSASQRRIAQERYQFVKRLETEFDMPFGSTQEVSTTALFPRGRSDRVYMMLLNVDWPPEVPGGKFLIFCYQRQHGKVKLVYIIKLKQRLDSKNYYVVHKKIAKIRNLVDYIDAIGLRVTGKISHYAKSDITRENQYVVYDCDNQSESLEVFWTSALNNGQDHQATEDEYHLYEDSRTKAKLKPGEFYKTYGLPMLKGE